MIRRPLLLRWAVPLVFLLCGVVVFHASYHASAAGASQRLKVLAIGNSFSVDAMEFLYQIAEEAGFEEIVLGNLYIGGASLETHWNNIQRMAPSYRYYKNVSGSWTSQPNRTLIYGLLDEDWDLITLQQASPLSGVASSYVEGNVLQNLIDYVQANKTNPDAKLVWHMTWAYQADSTHAGFANYDRDQHKMFASIVNAVRTHVLTNDAFAFIIPAGTAIQNVRTSYIGDVLTRDGYHLSNYLGRYIAGLTWFHAITGLPIDDLTYVPNRAQIPDEYLPIIKEAVQAAVAQPFAISISSYVERPKPEQLSSTEYTLLDWEPVGCAYWQSTHATNYAVLNTKENSTAGNLCYYVSSARMFTRDEIPVGSIIEIAPGYQYRPEGWVSLTVHRSRPATTSVERVVVTEEWWGNYQYRAFNVSLVGLPRTIENEVEETAAALRIYVPK